MLSLLSLRRKKSRVSLSLRWCLYGQVLTDVNPEEPEDADSLHRSPIDGEGDMSFSPMLPVIHNQLFCFSHVEIEVVVLAPKCQDSDLLSVGRLFDASDQASYGCVVSKLCDGGGAVGGYAVMREQRVQLEDVVLPMLPVRKFRIQSHRAVLSPRSLS